jgi:hypothetical protein
MPFRALTRKGIANEARIRPSVPPITAMSRDSARTGKRSRTSGKPTALKTAG